MLSPSLEDYLEEVYRMSQNKGFVRVSDIGLKLNVSMPSVTKALRKLKARLYISHERYGEIVLTEQGREIGKYLVERNQLLHEFLALIGAKCDIAAEAEAMEHYLSNDTIRAIQHLVKYMEENPLVYNKLKEYLRQHDR